MTPVGTPSQLQAVEPTVINDHAISIGSLVLDLATRTIYNMRFEMATQVKLSTNEFILLATLAKNCGRTVPAAALSQVIGGTCDVDEALVDVYVGYVRRKLVEAQVPATIERTLDGHRLCP